MGSIVKGGESESFFFRNHEAPPVHDGRSSALSGTVLGGQFRRLEVHQKRKRYRQVELKVGAAGLRSRQTGSPARRLQLNESHLAGILDGYL